MEEIVNFIDGEGTCHDKELSQFLSEIRLADCRTRYQVIAIMGPQSSGKSTLLNNLFGTNFRMMDAMSGRGQTTKGLWLSKSTKITEIATLVMDLEGSDGRERGEDDTNFERQSALLALAVADVLLVNIWCHDIGREQGSGKPLLKIIFQVNLKLFAPDPSRRRTVLLFVIRDKSKTPVPKLIEVLQADLHKMWDSISKPVNYRESKLEDHFEVQYAALSNYEEKQEEFLSDITTLRQRFMPDDEGSLIKLDNQLPGDTFALNVQEMWKAIKAQKDLNLPAHKVMVASIRCKQIKEEQLRAFAADQAWLTLVEGGRSNLVPNFGEAAFALVDSCLKGYEAEASYFDSNECAEKRTELSQALLQLLRPAWQQQVALLQSSTSASLERDFKAALADKSAGFTETSKRCLDASMTAFKSWMTEHMNILAIGWTGEEEVASMYARLAAHVADVREKHIAAATAAAEQSLAQAVSGPLINLLDSMPQDVWTRMHKVCHDAVDSAEAKLLESLATYDLPKDASASLSDRLAEVARNRLDTHAREASLTRLSRMKDRFTDVFTLTKDKTPRMWTAKDNIPAIAQAARLAAAHVLAQLAVVRPLGGAKNTELVDSAVNRLARMDLSSSADSSTPSDSFDILSATTWQGVDPDLVLQQPNEIRTTWREFVSWSNTHISQAQNAQHANKLAAARPPPLWAIAAILLLGWNEFAALMTSPLTLLTIALLLLFARTLYVELDVENELQHGLLPGVLSISANLLPASRRVIEKTTNTIRGLLAQPAALPDRAQQYAVEMTQRSDDASSSSSTPTPSFTQPHQAHPSAASLTSRKPSQA